MSTSLLGSCRCDPNIVVSLRSVQVVFTYAMTGFDEFCETASSPCASVVPIAVGQNAQCSCSGYFIEVSTECAGSHDGGDGLLRCQSLILSQPGRAVARPDHHSRAWPTCAHEHERRDWTTHDSLLQGVLAPCRIVSRPPPLHTRHGLAVPTSFPRAH